MSSGSKSVGEHWYIPSTKAHTHVCTGRCRSHFTTLPATLPQSQDGPGWSLYPVNGGVSTLVPAFWWSYWKEEVHSSPSLIWENFASYSSPNLESVLSMRFYIIQGCQWLWLQLSVPLSSSGSAIFFSLWSGISDCCCTITLSMFFFFLMVFLGFLYVFSLQTFLKISSRNAILLLFFVNLPQSKSASISLFSHLDNLLGTSAFKRY